MQKYERNGKVVFIEFERYFENSEVLFKMYYPGILGPAYYVPKYKFKNTQDVIDHILNNLETDNLKITVKPLDNKEDAKY